MNKRAQIGITITWMVAFLIIVFIMLLFTGMTAISAGKKQLNKNDLSVVADGFRKIETQRSLHIFLNSLTEFKGKRISFKDAFEESINPYADEEFLELLGVEGKINLVGGVKPERRLNAIESLYNNNIYKENYDNLVEKLGLTSDSEGVVKPLRVERELFFMKEELAKAVEGNLNDECFIYYLETPLFKIKTVKDDDGKTEYKRVTSPFENSHWTQNRDAVKSMVSADIYSDGEKIKISFYLKEVC